MSTRAFIPWIPITMWWLWWLPQSCYAKTPRGSTRAPTLAPGDGRKRDWRAISSHVELEWLNEATDCNRDANRDGDVVAFKHRGFIAELPPGKTTDGNGRPIQVGQQMDSNINSETKEDKPLEFTLGTPKLIVGMEAILRQMCEGEKVRAKIPGPLAYNTRAGFLPYDTAVLYEMEMVSITRGDGTIPTVAPPGPPDGPKGQDNAWLIAALIFLLAMVGGSLFFLRRGGKGAPEKVKGKEQKETKKEGKKKR